MFALRMYIAVASLYPVGPGIALPQERCGRFLKRNIWWRASRLDCIWWKVYSWREDSPLMNTWITTQNFLQTLLIWML